MTVPTDHGPMQWFLHRNAAEKLAADLLAGFPAASDTSSPPPPSPDWQHVTGGSKQGGGVHVMRLPVPGGWLYHTNNSMGETAVVFVPSPSGAMAPLYPGAT